MISSFFVLLLLIGFSGTLFSRERYARFVSFIIAIIGFILLFNLYRHMQLATTSQTLWNLLDYKRLQVDLDLSSNKINYSLIFPFFLMTCLSLLYTCYTPSEERRGRLSSLMLIVQAFFILLACCNNLLILIVSTSLIGIVGIYIINDFVGKKSYVFYTLIADMSLFATMSIIYSATSSVDLSALSDFSLSHKNKDLASLLLLIGIGIKSGLFMFHNQLFSYRELSFNRLIFLNYCVSPASALILFTKTQSLFISSEISGVIMLVLSFLSVIYGFLGTLIYDNLKEKVLSLNMVLWGGLFATAVGYQSSIFPLYGLLIVLFFLFNLWVAEISFSASEEFYISRLGGLWRKLPLLLGIGGILSVAILQALLAQVASYPYFGWTGVVIIILLFPYLIRQIFFGSNNSDDKVWAFMKHPPMLLMLPILVVSIVSLFYNEISNWVLLAGITLMVIFILVNPLSKFAILYERDELQLSDFFERIYEIILLAPLSVLGRVLWLTVDFLLIERTILNSISHMQQGLIHISSRMHSCRLIGYVLTTLLGIIIMFIFLMVKL